MFIAKQEVDYVNYLNVTPCFIFSKGFVVKHKIYSEIRDCAKLTKFLTRDKQLIYIKPEMRKLTSGMAVWQTTLVVKDYGTFVLCCVCVCVCVCGYDVIFTAVWFPPDSSGR